MAFLVPDNLKSYTMHWHGTLDNLTDIDIGKVRGEIDLFYIEVHVLDANDTFSATVVTLQYDDGASGADTEIDAISIAANTRYTSVDRDGMTNTRIPDASRILMTVDDIATGADQGIVITFWYVNGEQRVG